MEETPIKRGLLVLAVIAMFGAQLIVSPSSARASILAGCVGTDDTSVAGVIGWVDVGVMLGTEAARAPGLTTVIAPDGTPTNFLNGDGLIQPTDEMPIWFAPADQLGDYTVTTDGDACVATVTALAKDEELTLHSLNIDWEVHSALVK